MTAGQRLGAYECIGRLGAGGMGEVYRARDTRLDRDVAIKVLPASVAGDPDRLMRFEREAKTLAALNHPHIAQIYGLEQTGDTSALVMELVEGEDLAQRIARGPLPLDEALPIARQIAEALEAAHEAGIIHRDLKPANIKVRPDGMVKVLDFGLAKAIESGIGIREPGSGPTLANSPTITSPAVTAHGIILGTAAYMSPEQARGASVDTRTDIWAFGCVLYEMLTGHGPFAADTVSDTIAAILSREPALDQLPANTPHSVRRLLRRCLARDPRGRLRHIADARLELQEMDVGEAALPRAAAPAGLAWMLLAAVAVAAATAGAITVSLVPRTASLESRGPLHLSLPTIAANAAVNGVLVSPDGQYVVAVGPSGASTLHALDGSPSRPLNDVALCWSPDSRSLVLQRANHELLKMDVSGGPAVPFASAARGAAGCSWHANGSLLFDDERAIYQVAAAGGPLIRVALEDAGGDDAGRFYPRFLPDGRRFLYWFVAGDGRRSVRAGSLDSPETTNVVESDAPAVYRSGYVVFQRGATLVAQALDERSLSVQGEPRALTSEAAPGAVPHLAVFDVSDTGMLVFHTTNSGIKGQQVWIDRRGSLFAAVPQAGGGELLNLALSTDATRAAAARMDPSTGNWDIWTVDLGSGIPTRVTTHPAIESDPVWSPDDSTIAYVSRRPDAPGIYRLSLIDGREELLLKSRDVFARGSSALRVTDWTDDGRFIVYEAADDILALPAGAGGVAPVPVVATPSFEAAGKVSRDGQWIAFHSADSPGDDNIYIQPFPGPGARTRISAGFGRHPHWRSDTRELLWQGIAPGDPSNPRTVYSAELTFAGRSVRAGAPQVVLPSHVRLAPLVDDRPHWTVTADGQRFLLRQPGGRPGPAVKVILNWMDQIRER